MDTSPELSTATQKLEEGHDTEAKLPFGSIDRGTDHVMVVAVVVVVVVWWWSLPFGVLLA